MKKIAVVTATRAEYGLLLPVLRELRKYEQDSFLTELIVTGTHLSVQYGHTIDEIKKNNVRIDEVVEIPVDSDNAVSLSCNQAVILERFAGLFSEKQYSGIVVLGDRYEMLMIVLAAANTHTPVFHLCGGDTTEGAIDEFIRHSITKMSYLHFPTNEISKNRVIQLGEAPDRVYQYGSPGNDNILNLDLMDKEGALRSIGLTDCKYALCTYHPVTMNEEDDVKALVLELLDAMEEFPELQFIITKSNADVGGTVINRVLDEEAEKRKNIHVYASLGIMRYLSLMKHAEFVIGNSSSGILETPLFHIPTINIGDRQKGRLQTDSILNCRTDKESISAAIRQCSDGDFLRICKQVVSPYGDGSASVKIAATIADYIMERNDKKIDLAKSFFDLKVECE